MTGSGKSVYLSHLGKWKACIYHTTLLAWTRLVFLLTDLMSGIVGRILIQATWKDARLYPWIQYKYLLHLTADGINKHPHTVTVIQLSHIWKSNIPCSMPGLLFYLWSGYTSSQYLSTLEGTDSYRYWHHLCRFLRWHTDDRGNRQCCSHSLSHWNLVWMIRNDYSLF